MAELTFTQIESFGLPGEAGFQPNAGVLKASDGYLYGTTELGGFGGTLGGYGGGGGTIYRVKQDGTDFTTLKLFVPGDGLNPEAPLIEGSDGVLYGTANNPSATFFRINKDGSGYTVLKRDISGNCFAALLEASDGALYGTTYTGGEFGGGTIFRLNRDGTDYTVLKNLGGSDGASSVAPLIEGIDGALYGTASSGGSFSRGTVFRLNKDGSNYAVIKDFSGGDGAYPLGTVIQGIDGVLYGATSGGGVGGIIFRLNTDGSGFTVLHDGIGPTASLFAGSDGVLYGTVTESAGNRGFLFRINKDGSGYTLLKTFTSVGLLFESNGQPNNEGARPRCALIEGDNGSLYGTTSGGGEYSWGTVFRINKDGSSHTILRAFRNIAYGSAASQDGALSTAAVIEGSDGALYGTTRIGGAYGLGTVFRANKDGSGNILLKSFPGVTADVFDGATPWAPVLEGSDGLLYGTTVSGGVGVLFRLAKNGSGYTILVQFGGSKGSGPRGPLIEGSDGAIYGTATGGAYGQGTLFKVQKDGTGFTVLYAFGGSYLNAVGPGIIEGSDGVLYGTSLNNLFRVNKDGSDFTFFEVGSTTPLVEGSDGALYGTSAADLFKVDKDGFNYTVLRHFYGFLDNGVNLTSALIEGLDGAMYGTSSGGGSAGQGAVLRINKDGSGFEVVKDFPYGLGQPRVPLAPLIRARDGTLFGTTALGGDSDLGTIFQISGATAFNRLPVARADSIFRPDNTRIIKVLKSVLLANDTDPDSDLLSLTGVGSPSPAGAAVSIAGNFVVYIAPGNSIGDGSFTYTLSDGPGGHSVTATVSVVQTSPTPNNSGPNAAKIAMDGHNFIITFIGVPGHGYRVQYTTSLDVPYNWSDFNPLAIYTAPANGVFSCTDVNPPGPIRIYRAVSQP